MSHASRKHAVDVCTQTWISKKFRNECIAKARFNGELWTVWERSVLKTGQTIERRIVLFVLIGSGDGHWAVRSGVPESDHPNYHNCPLRFLAMVPDVTCQRWRDEVLAHHVEIKRRRELVKNIRPGDVVRCAYVKPGEYRVMSTSPLIGKADNGSVYHIPTTRVIEIINRYTQRMN